MDVLVMSASSGNQQNTVKVPLTSHSHEKVVLVVKSLGRDEYKVGSISIHQDTFLVAGESKHRQWITLFDHLDDDEYDGDMGENDDEVPRVQCSFQITSEPKNQAPPARDSIQSNQSRQQTNILSSSKSPPRDNNLTMQKKTSYPVAEIVPQPVSIMKRPARDTSGSGNPALNTSSYSQSFNKTMEYSYSSNTQQPQPKQPKPAKPASKRTSPIKSVINDDFDIQKEMAKQDPVKRYRVDFLQRLLDDKLTYLVKTLEEQQKENFEIEDEVLERLGLLKSLNTEVEHIYKQQSANVVEVQKVLTNSRNNHKKLIDDDQEKIHLEAKMKELEKTLVVLRNEVEQAAFQNEKLKITKDERLSRDLNGRAFVDKKQNEQSRE